MEVQERPVTGDVPADSRVLAQLRVGERLLEYRSQAALTRVTDDTHSADPTNGALVLTDQRLLHLDGEDVSIDLAEIEELALAGDRLLVTLAGLHGLIIETDSAPEFRAAISAAISALRTR